MQKWLKREFCEFAFFFSLCDMSRYLNYTLRHKDTERFPFSLISLCSRYPSDRYCQLNIFSVHAFGPGL